MTIGQAYQILNVSSGSSRQEIEQAYKVSLRALQLRLVAGQPVTVRQKAEDQIAQLKTAFELLINAMQSGVPSVPAGGYSQTRAKPQVVPQVPPIVPQVRPATIPQVRPTTQLPAQPTAPAATPLGPTPQAYPWVLPVGFAVAAAVMLFIILCCVRPTASHDTSRRATLRVWSVPWSHVEVNGEPLGPTGQMAPFVLPPGDHRLVLLQGGRALSTTVHLPEGLETVVKAQLEEGKINVVYRQQ